MNSLHEAGTPKGYTKWEAGWYYWVELGAIVAWLAAFAGTLWRLAPRFSASPWLIVWTAILGYVAADFLSGFVHWAGDTWGSDRTPVVGRTLISGFRAHHVDQKGITRHDIVDTNGNNCLFALLPMLALLVAPLSHPLIVALASFLAFTSLWTMATNQIHKWAHQDSVPRVVSWLQRAGLILHPEHHTHHHAAPYLVRYCITVGWCNPVLDRIGFFRNLEKLIHAVTGVVPRGTNGEAETFGVFGEVVAPPAESAATPPERIRATAQ